MASRTDVKTTKQGEYGMKKVAVYGSMVYILGHVSTNMCSIPEPPPPAPPMVSTTPATRTPEDEYRIATKNWITRTLRALSKELALESGTPPEDSLPYKIFIDTQGLLSEKKRLLQKIETDLESPFISSQQEYALTAQKTQLSTEIDLLEALATLIKTDIATSVLSLLERLKNAPDSRALEQIAQDVDDLLRTFDGRTSNKDFLTPLPIGSRLVQHQRLLSELRNRFGNAAIPKIGSRPTRESVIKDLERKQTYASSKPDKSPKIESDAITRSKQEALSALTNKLWVYKPLIGTKQVTRRNRLYTFIDFQPLLDTAPTPDAWENLPLNTFPGDLLLAGNSSVIIDGEPVYIDEDDIKALQQRYGLAVFNKKIRSWNELRDTARTNGLETRTTYSFSLLPAQQDTATVPVALETVFADVRVLHKTLL